MVKRKSKKSVARKVKSRSSAKKAAPRKMKRGYDIHPGQPTGREVQAMHRLQVLTERYMAERSHAGGRADTCQRGIASQSTQGLARGLARMPSVPPGARSRSVGRSFTEFHDDPKIKRAIVLVALC
jgi:hypothetical protein